MSRTSEAARAVEEMHGKCLPGYPRPMKVLFACNRDCDEQLSDDAIMEQLMRLFIVIPKWYKESDIHDRFERFGGVHRVSILRDKETGESKGLAFVRFQRASQAALAYENCDPDFRPKFADPPTTRASKREREPSPSSPVRRERGSTCECAGNNPNDLRCSRFPRTVSHRCPLPCNNSHYGLLSHFAQAYRSDGPRRLIANVRGHVSPEQLNKLFGIVPCLEYCDVHPDPSLVSSTIYVKYATAECCAYAMETISGFEYPPGCPLLLKYYEPDSTAVSSSFINRRHGSDRDPSVDISHEQKSGAHGGDCTRHGHVGDFVQHTHELSSVSKHSIRDEEPLSGSNSSSHCIEEACSQLGLPAVQPLYEGQPKKRLFIVSSPTRMPASLLRNIFCRFGYLINADYLPGKNCGFARYGSDESAQAAKVALNGVEVSGCRIKVLDAEDPPEERRPRKTRIS